jgi:hypothetical protein
MGRALTQTLKEAQKRWLILHPPAIPAIKVELVDKWGCATNFHWFELYSGSETDYFHAATIAGDGSLIRLRVDPSDNHLYRQKV